MVEIVNVRGLRCELCFDRLSALGTRVIMNRVGEPLR